MTLARGRRPVYEDPEKFFALTYPTHALRELVKDVAERLAGRSDKTVREFREHVGADLPAAFTAALRWNGPAGADWRR